MFLFRRGTQQLRFYCGSCDGRETNDQLHFILIFRTLAQIHLP